MTGCHRDKVGFAKQRVIEEFAQFRKDSSDARLASLKAAIDNWHDKVAAWNEADRAEPIKGNLN